MGMGVIRLGVMGGTDLKALAAAPAEKQAALPLLHVLRRVQMAVAVAVVAGMEKQEEMELNGEQLVREEVGADRLLIRLDQGVYTVAVAVADVGAAPAPKASSSSRTVHKTKKPPILHTS